VNKMGAKFKEGRPAKLTGNTFLLSTGCGKLYITVNQDEFGCPAEVLARMGKTGGCVASQIEGLGRLVSISLQSGADVEQLIKQLRGIRCPSPSEPINGENKVTSCSDAFAQALDMFLNGGKVTEIDEAMLCHNCGEKLTKKDNLLVCLNCGRERSD
jgi:ribonucleoside-diphosphate reductase alpha chain